MGALLVLFAGAALATALDGTNRADRLVGTERADTIRGLGGGDLLRGRGGADTLGGGSGRDTVYGGDGDDTLRMRDGVAGNDAARCGTGYDVARVDSRDEASLRSTPSVPEGQAGDALCESAVFEAEATGVVEPMGGDGEIGIPEDPQHKITDEASGTTYALQSGTVDLSAYEGRRVTVSGPVTARYTFGGRMVVERVEPSEPEPAAGVPAD